MTHQAEEERGCYSRRRFLLMGGSVAAATVFLSAFPESAMGAKMPALLARYPRKKIVKLSQLRNDVPVEFKYPYDDPVHSASFLVKLGVRAGGGVGPEGDIVSFNALCTHMGGPLMGKYKKDHRAVGPCPIHLTTFDLTRHGMVIAGHATESLPQIVLEVKGDDIYATGVMGLIYGRDNNLRP